MLPKFRETTNDMNIARERMLTLLKGGWCQKSYGKLNLENAGINDVVHDNVDAVCLRGAMIRANIEKYPFFSDVEHELIEIIRRKYANFNNTLVYFNDYIAKSVDDVIEVVSELKKE